MSAELLSQVGSSIRSLRKRAGLTISQLAESAGIDPGFLAYIETGKKMPSMVTAAKIAAALNVSLSDLLKGVKTPGASNPLASQISARVQVLCRGCSRAHMNDLFAVLKLLSNPNKVKALRLLTHK